MKKAFQIIKDRPQVKTTITRDSVCMADDCEAPHEKKITIPSFVDPAVLATGISSGYLPLVHGTGHTWICSLNGKRIAEIKNDGVDSLVKELSYMDENEIHFTYQSSRHENERSG